MKTQDKLQKARDLIQKKRYKEAQKILKTVNHPKARDWLAKVEARLDDPFIEQVEPQQPLPVRLFVRTVIIVIAFLPAALIGHILNTMMLQNNRAKCEFERFVGRASEGPCYGLDGSQSLLMLGFGVIVFLSVVYILDRAIKRYLSSR